MAIDISSLAIQIKSEGITKATQDLKALAEAAKGADKETKVFISTANQASNTRVTNDADKQALIQQRRDYELFNVTVKQYVQAHSEALAINRALAAEESKRNIIQQNRDIELYNIKVKEQVAALKEVEQAQKAAAKAAADSAKQQLREQSALNSAMGQALEINKRMDWKRLGQDQSEALKINKAMTDSVNSVNAAHGQALEMNKKFDWKKLGQDQTEAIKINKAMNKSHEEAVNTLKNMNGHGSIWNNTLKSMAVAATAYIGVNMAKGIIAQGDAWQMMQAKLKLAIGTSEDAKRTQADLYDLAQKLRIPLEDSAKLYTRMAIPMQQLGKSSKDTMGMVEGMGLALKLSGATAQEASSVMLQFSQSMNAGRLNGGEFNAVAEGAPIILRAIEEELRRTGQWGENTTETLKKMGSEGKISAQLLSDAMAHALPKWREDFESLPLTVEGAVQRIKNSWFKAIGEMSQSEGLNKELARVVGEIESSIPKVAETLVKAFVMISDNIKPILTGLSILLGMKFTAWAAEAVLSLGSIAKAIGLVTLASELFAVTPVGAIVAGIALAVGASVAAWNLYKTATEGSSVANENYKVSSDKFIDQLKAENEQARKNYEVMFKIKQLKDEGTQKTSQPTNIEDLSKSLQILERMKLLNRDAEAARLRGQGDVAKEYQEKAKVAALDYAKAKALEDETANLNRVTAAEGVRNIQRKEAQALYDKFGKSDSDKRKEQIDALNKIAYQDGVLIMNAKEYAKTLEGINSSFTDSRPKANKTQLDYYQKAKQALEEIKQAYEGLQKYGLDDKRTAGEKQLVKLEAELEANIERRSAATKDGTITQLKQEEVIIRNAIATERLVIAEEKKYNSAKQDMKLVEEDTKARENAIEQAKKEADVLEQAVQNHGKLAKSKEEVQLQYALEEQAVLELDYTREREMLQNEKLIEQLQRTITFRKQLEEQAMTDKAAKKYEADWQAANKKIGDGLYEALSSNGSSFVKKLVKDLKEGFARLVLSPIIQPIASFGASLLNPMAASASGASAAGTAGSMVSGIGNLFSSFMNLGTNFAGSLGAGIEGLGAKMGSDFLASLGGGISGSGTLTATGAGIGSGLSASIGSQIGSTLTPLLQAVPYIAAAYAVYSVLESGFSMGEKQITGSNVSGTLGTENIARNVNWAQEGGMFRSNRSGTWSYNLANSVAIADGVGYTDTASLASDKALLKALNDSYTVLKTSTAEYAKILGINADDIASRNDQMSFAIGKTAEETNTNITNMFKEVGNNIAKGLLGTYSSLAKDSETAAETLTRLATEVTTVDAAVKTLGLTFSTGFMDVIYTADATFSKFTSYTTEQLVTMKDALVQASGGLEAFLTQSAYFAQNFLSEAEKIKPSQDQVAKIFDQYHVTNVTTIEDYKKLVQGIDLSTESGRAMYAALMLLAPTFKQVADYSGSAADSSIALARALADTNKSIQDQIDALLKSSMTTEQIRAAELTGVDASTAALLRRLHALQDEKAATEAASAALEAAASRARAVADERYGLETQLLQEEGKTDELRKRELDKLDPSNQELQKRIWALQDEKTATEAASAAMEAAAKAVKDAWQSITNTIMDEVRRIRGLVDEQSGMGFAEAQAKFATTTAQARAGDQEAAKLLPSLSQALLTLAEKNAKTAEELSYIRAMTANSLAQTAGGFSSTYGLSLPSFDVGTDSVPHDMIAQIHAGEEIVPAAYTGKNNSELVTEIKSLKEEVSKMRTESNAQQQAIAISSAKTAKILTQNDFGQGILVTTSLPV